jgi:hypothetical protein
MSTRPNQILIASYVRIRSQSAPASELARNLA